MYIYEGDRRDLVFDMVNWLYYLNYESISHILIGCH